MLRYLLLTLGLAVLGLLVWHIGPGNIYDAASRLGPGTLVVILIPSLVMYAIEAYGWRMVLGPSAQAVPFWRLLAIRTAGEVVNMTTPTAYLGGEPLKAYLLRSYNVPIAEGAASVVIAKTTMTIAEVFYILVGIALGFWILGVVSSAGQSVAAALVSVGLLVCSIVGFVLIQRRGLFASILGMIRKLGLRIKSLESQEVHLLSIDQTIQNYYSHHQRAFYASIGVYFLGWMAEAMEVFVILYYLGGPTDVLGTISIGALAVFIKGGTFFIPGSLGAQDGGNLLLLKAFGYSDVTGITFALLRRFRELVWIGIGLLCLALVGKGAVRQAGDRHE
ncbi:MAG: flippase-like domain-containing protein [Nitrospira sp.]|nr:flippase-like domain-containing protein [Nitrospira sp.]